MGPYKFHTVFDNGTARLITIDESHTHLIMNGHRLRLYHRPNSRDSFIKYLSDNSGFEVISAGNFSFAPLRYIYLRV